MTTTYLESQGAVLKRGDGGGTETFTAVGQIISIAGPGGEASEIDVTTLDSTAREFAMGLKDEGEISLEMVFDPANAEHLGLKTDQAARTLRNFQLLLTDSGPTQWDFAAYVKSIAYNMAVDDVLRATVTLRLSGAITWS